MPDITILTTSGVGWAGPLPLSVRWYAVRFALRCLWRALLGYVPVVVLSEKGHDDDVRSWYSPHVH